MLIADSFGPCLNSGPVLLPFAFVRLLTSKSRGKKKRIAEHWKPTRDQIETHFTNTAVRREVEEGKRGGEERLRKDLIN